MSWCRPTSGPPIGRIFTLSEYKISSRESALLAEKNNGMSTRQFGIQSLTFYGRMDKHPKLEWTIIIDRLNGNSSYPDTDWTTAITHIRTTYKNARLVGYVRVNYGNEPIANVESNVNNYAR
jgi:hypothetical protein